MTRKLKPQLEAESYPKRWAMAFMSRTPDIQNEMYPPI